MQLINTTNDTIALDEVGIEIPSGNALELLPNDFSDLSKAPSLVPRLLSGEVQLLLHNTAEAGDVAAMLIFGDNLPAISPQFLTKYAFRQRFTPSEKYQISNEPDSIAKMALLDFYSALYVNLASDVVDDYLNLLISLGIINTQRKSEILTY
jgi:hypothetical protein